MDHKSAAHQIETNSMSYTVVQLCTCTVVHLYSRAQAPIAHMSKFCSKYTANPNVWTGCFVVPVGWCTFSDKAKDEASGNSQSCEGHQQQLITDITFEEQFSWSSQSHSYLALLAVSGSSDGSKCSSAINKTEALEKDPPLDINKVEDMTKSSVQQPVVSSSMEERKQQRRIQHQDISRDRLPPSGMMLRNGLLISKMFNKISLRAHHRTRVHSRWIQLQAGVLLCPKFQTET